MKKIILSFAILLAFGYTHASGNEWPGVSDRIVETFRSEFKGATYITWIQENGIHRARFILNQEAFLAFFNEEGDLLGSLRDVPFEKLPSAVAASFEKMFPAAEYINVHEINNPEGICYWLTLEANNKRYHVKSNADGLIQKKESIKVKKIDHRFTH